MLAKCSTKDIIRALAEFQILLEQYKIGKGTDFISKKDLSLLNIRGHEFVVFKYKDKVVKIHRKHFVDINNLDEQNMLSLVGLPTKRILLPQDVVYNLDDVAKGYVMEFVTGEKNMANESMDHFLDEANYLNEDKKVFDEERILLQDLHENNAMYNGKINIVDSGRFINTHIMLPTYMRLEGKHSMRKLNEEELENLDQKVALTNTIQLNEFYYKIIMQTIYGEISYRTYKFDDYFKEKTKEMGTDNYLDVIESICDRNMTVEEFASSLNQKVLSID